MIKLNFPFRRGTLGVLLFFVFFIVWISGGLTRHGFCCVCLNAKSGPSFHYGIFRSLSRLGDPAARSRVNISRRACVRVCLLHMRICSTDVSWLPGSRLSSLGLFGSGCDMVTHSSIWSSDWVTQGKLNDTEQYITSFSRPARTVEQMIIRKHWSKCCCPNPVDVIRPAL